MDPSRETMFDAIIVNAENNTQKGNERRELARQREETRLIEIRLREIRLREIRLREIRLREIRQTNPYRLS